MSIVLATAAAHFAEVSGRERPVCAHAHTQIASTIIATARRFAALN
jgi:hypothetical protein